MPFKLLAALKPVSMEDVDRVVEANDRAVQGCNRNGRRVDTLAVLMTMTIEADGKVSEVDAGRPRAPTTARRRRGRLPGAGGQEAQVPRQGRSPCTHVILPVH